MQNLPPKLAEVLVQVAAMALDPDYKQYPDLFTKRTIGEEEIQAHYAAQLVNPKASLQPVSPSDRCSGKLGKHRFVPWSVEERKIPESVLKRSGWTRRKARGASLEPVTRLVPVEWVDRKSGEIFTTAELRKHVQHTGHKMPGTGSISERAIRAAAKVGECPPSERKFVAAVLRMRNHRGGLVLDLNTLIDRWIAWKHPNVADKDKARKRKQLSGILEKRKIMANPQTLYRDLQMTGNTDPHAAIMEAGQAYSVIPVCPNKFAYGHRPMWLSRETSGCWKHTLEKENRQPQAYGASDTRRVADLPIYRDAPI
jgi:hypothetical protein